MSNETEQRFLLREIENLKQRLERLEVQEKANFIWQSYTVNWTATITNPSIGNGTKTGRYAIIGKTCHCTINITMGSTTTYGSGNWAISLPFDAANNTGIVFLGIAHLRKGGTGDWERIAEIVPSLSANTIYIFNDPTQGSDNSYINATTPFNWSSGNNINIEITYELI